MDRHGDITDELSGDGMLIIDGHDVALVPYSLTVSPEAGPLIAEGAIRGPEPLMRRVRKAKAVQLALEDGPTVALRCEGGNNGTRWVKALRP